MMASRLTRSLKKVATPMSGKRFMSVITISDMDATTKFQEVNEKNVMYFTATWCPPCKVIKPVYEELAKKYDGVSFGKVDVDDNSEAAMEFQIAAVPTFIFSNGQRFSGADPNQLEELIRALDEE